MITWFYIFIDGGFNQPRKVTSDIPSYLTRCKTEVLGLQAQPVGEGQNKIYCDELTMRCSYPNDPQFRRPLVECFIGAINRYLSPYAVCHDQQKGQVMIGQDPEACA